MPKSESNGRWGLLLVVLAVAAGLFLVVKSRVQQGDAFPAGSSFRSEPSGLLALHEALVSQGKYSVRRERGQLSGRTDLSRTTLLVASLSPRALYDVDEKLARSLTALVRAGLRVVVLLDTDVAERCREERCGVPEPSASGEHDKPAEAKKGPQGKAKLPEKSPNLLTEWGLSLSGHIAPHDVVRAAESPAWFKGRLPWRGHAFFVPQDAAWRVLYEQEKKAVVAERKLGNGELVVVASTYPVSNEALAKDRATSFVVWLVGDRPNVVFEEAHLGLVAPKGVVSMARSYGLDGALYGLLIATLMYVWYAGSPLLRRAPRRDFSHSGSAAHGRFSSLLMRAVPAKELFATCMKSYLATLSPAKREAFVQAGPLRSGTSKLQPSRATIDEYNHFVAQVAAQRSIAHKKAQPL